MTEIDTDERRAGTAVTFTGKGSRDRDLRLRFVMIVPGVATLCVLGAVIWYLMVRPVLPHTAPVQSGPAASSAAPSAIPSAAGPDHPFAGAPAAPPTVPPGPASTTGALAGGVTQHAAPPSSAHAAVVPGTRPARPRAPSAPARAPEHAGTETSQPTGAQASQQPASPGPTPPARFHVQAGSFEDRDNAMALVTQLRRRGYAAALIEGPLYRVWVGGYVDRDTGERLIANLRSDGFEAALTPR
jgi:cell division protein FtsN